MDEQGLPRRIDGFLERFTTLIPTDRRVRMTIQSYITNILELDEQLEKHSVRCTGKKIFLAVHPYLKKELLAHKHEILTLLREKDHLFFDALG